MHGTKRERERERTALNAFHLVGVSRIGAQNMGR
jgi:hypothetical protein